MSATTPETTSREYRDKVRKLTRVICAAGYDAMRRNYHIIQAARHFNKFYSVDFYEPYEFQRKWLRSGARFRLRMLSAANRIGKTRTGAVEFAYHATGCYPEWWEGYVCPFGILWAIGVSAESTRKVLQKELLGTSDARQKHLFGTGTIPRERINFESFVCDGEAVKSFRVFNISGEESEIHFYSATQDESVLMGQSIVFGWVDEQSEKEDELVSQCTTRTTTTRGVVAITATPEVGITPLYERCSEDKTGKIHFQNAVWDDAPHLTEEDKADMLAMIPYFQREMRSQGVPVVGVGLIYPFPNDKIICADFAIPDHWPVLAAVDFGVSGIADPSVIVFITMNPDTEEKYLFAEWGSETDRDEQGYSNSHLPDYMARKLVGAVPDDWKDLTGREPAEFTGMGLPSIAVKLPHDGANIQPGTQATRAEIMRAISANTCMDLFEIPADMAPLETNRKSLMGSIALIAQWFQDNKLHIFSSCTETLAELRLYQWKKKGNRTIPSDRRNHFLDAMRYGAIRVRDDGIPLYEARKNPDTNTWEVSNPYESDMGAFAL